MSRVTAPVAKLTRAISSAPGVARISNPLLDSTSHNAAGAALMPKYAELLRNRLHDHSDSSRGLTTTHRPVPQPSIADRNKPLMQTFHSSAHSSTPSSNMDSAVLPSMDFENTASFSVPRMPLLPDNYGAAHIPTGDAPVITPAIVAIDPARVEPATSRSAVESVGLDGIELKFMYEEPVQAQEHHGGMIRDLWKGMVDDILGPAPVQKTA